jgi:hypothetical protein
MIRPDVFRSAVLMSVPFTGPPALPFNSANRSQAEEAAEDSANNMRAQVRDLMKLLGSVKAGQKTASSSKAA